MAYTKKTWVTGETIQAVDLNHLESGVELISANGAIDTANLADGAAVTAKIGDGAVTSVKLGSDVSGAISLAINGQVSITIADYDYTACTISASNTLTRSGNNYRSRQVTYNADWHSIQITANTTRDANVTFLTEALPQAPTSGTDITSLLATGESGRHIISKGTTQVLTIPSNTTVIVIAYTSNGGDATPTYTIAYTSMGRDVNDCKDGLASKLDATYPMSMNYSDVYGSDNYPLGWQTGYYNGSGVKGSSTEAIITTNGYDYVARTGDTKITFTVPNGVSASIIEYDSNGTFVQRIGGWESGVNAQTVTPTVGYKYRFMVSGLTDSENYLTEAYIETCVALIYKDVIAWQNDQDNRINVLENGASEIPSYYTIGGYLQGKVDTISAIQNSLGADQDAFLFVTDYHHQYNQGNSLALMSYVARRTGIKKLFFAGDAGGAQGTSAAAVYHRLQMSAQVWDSMTDAVGEMYGVLGNHEWINTGTATIAAVMGSYLNRYKNKVIGMDATTGNYYFDNVANKIRYFFINDTNASYPISGSIPWLAAELANVPDGYSVCVVTHFAFIPNSATLAEYDGYEVTYNYTSIKAVSQLLAAMRDKTSFTYSGTTYDYSSLTGTRHVIGIFSGHIHHGFLYTESTETGIEDIAVFRGMTDGLSAAISVDGMPWYWQDGIVGGTKVVREPDTVTEQCFYAVQIDMTNKKLYITAIGGDHDWEGYYES